MFHHVLVPLDGTPQAAVALPLARALARVTHARVRLVTVARPGDMAMRETLPGPSRVPSWPWPTRSMRISS
jgi:nucleotide-binding universal stress UspA family protein